MPTTKVEYGAYYPFNLEADTEWVYYGPVSKHEAMAFVGFVNTRMLREGSALRARPVQRTVVTGEWE